MDDTLFAALDRMIEAGGQKIAKGALIGSLAKKPADGLLADLQKQGYIQKDGSKFTLTEEGRRAWKNKASEARKLEVEEIAVTACLATMDKMKAKPLTAKPGQPFDEGIIQRVVAEAMVIDAGANKYRLSPKGEEFLKAREPLEQQLERLRTASEDLLKRPQVLLQRLARDAEQLAEGEAVRSAFAEARAEIQEKVASAQTEFERALDGLQAFGSLIAAGQAFKKTLPAAVSGVLERMDAEAGRVQKLGEELRQTANQFRKELEQARQQMDQRAAAVEEKARAEKKTAHAGGTLPAPSRPAAAEPAPDEVIWQALRQAYEQLEQQLKLTTELIKVPNLMDKVRAQVPGLTVARFHDLLQHWQRADRLVLQVCNNPHAEPRSAEGIQSSRGLLFYVEMK